MKLADYIIKILEVHGVKRIYGYPGASILPLIEAIHHNPNVKWIMVRNEHAASLAAAAEARLTGRIAVCLFTSGPGATNAISGLLDASLENTPVIALTGLVPIWKQGRSGFQDANQTKLIGACVPYSETCSHPNQLPTLIRSAIGFAEHNRNVSHLAIPSDIQNLNYDLYADSFSTLNLPKALGLLNPPIQALKMVANELDHHTGIVIIVGPNAKGAGSAIEQLAECLQAPMITTLNAKGIIDESHSLCIGVLGIFGAPGNEFSRDILSESEVILSFGVEDVAPFIVNESGKQIRTLIECESEFSSVNARYSRNRTLVGAIEPIASSLIEFCKKKENPALIKKLAQKRKEFETKNSLTETKSKNFIHPATFLRHLSAHLKKDSIIALDVGDCTVWSAIFLTLVHRERILISQKFGNMGFCTPAILAAQLECPHSKVIGITGDGGLQMTLAEMMTIAQYKLPVILIVFKNNVLQRVRAQQKIAFGTEILNPNFMLMAESFGWKSKRIDGNTDVDAVLSEAFAQVDTPFLIELLIDPELKALFALWEDTFVPIKFS